MDKDTNKAELFVIEASYVRERASKRLQFAINTLQRSMYDLELYLEKFDAATSDPERAQILNWSINHLASSILQNFRIDLLADSQAELAKLAVAK